MRRHPRGWRLALAGLALLAAGAGCKLFQAKQADEKPAKAAAQTPAGARDWGQTIGGSAYQVTPGDIEESGFAAHADRIGLAQVDTLRLEGPQAAAKVAAFLTDPSPAVRQRAVDVLAEWGQAAEGAAPRALELLRSSDAEQRLVGAKTLAAIASPSSEDALERALKDQSPAVAAWARAALVRAGADCDDHLSEVAESVARHPGRIPAEAADALAVMPCQDAEALEDAAGELLPGFERSDETGLAAVAKAVGVLGPAAAAAVPGLVGLLGKQHPPRVRQAAMFALARMGAHGAPAVALLA
ncbi:MAG TPA: HEAT repeat domain-containing protein, partial [Myxococcota bacterium]|nr:HEAT repeat domain-containing protein [Myxococcota bacterium]